MSRFVLALLFMSASGANASCEDLLKYINYEVSRRSSDVDEQNLNIASFCEASYESSTSAQKAQIEASYKAIFSANASGSTESIVSAQKQKCDNKYGSEFRRSHGISEDSRVSPVVGAALEKCYASRGFSLESIAYGGGDVSLDFRWNGNASLKVGAPEFDEEKISCASTHDGEDAVFPLTLFTGGVLHVRCVRTSKRLELGGDENVLYFPETLLSVGSGYEQVAIPFPEVSTTLLPSGRLDGIEDRLAEVESKVGTMGERLSELTEVGRSAKDRIDQLERLTYYTVLSDAGGRHHQQRIFENGHLVESVLTCPPGLAMWGIGFGKGQQDAWLLCANTITTAVR